MGSIVTALYGEKENTRESEGGKGHQRAGQEGNASCRWRVTEERICECSRPVAWGCIVMALSTLELELFRCGTLELEWFRCGRVVPMEGGDVEELVDGYGCFGGWSGC